MPTEIGSICQRCGIPVAGRRRRVGHSMVCRACFLILTGQSR